MEKLDNILAAYSAVGSETKGKVLGASFVVTDGKGIIYSGAAGRTDLPEDSKTFTPSSFSWVASMTKFLTSVSAMQLVEQGLLSLDQDLRPLIPEFRDAQILIEFDADDKPVMQANTKPITLRQLLTHTSGFSYEFSDPTLLKWSRQQGRDVRRVLWTRQEVTTPLRSEPGETWTYGVSSDWAGLVVEAVSRQKLGDYMQRHIFTPLGMLDSGFRTARLAHVAPRVVENAVRHPKTGELKKSTWAFPKEREHEVESGGGGLFTTGVDYAKFLRAFLTGQLLKRETSAEMLKPQLTDAQRDWLQAIAFHPDIKNTFAPEFDEGTKLDHGLGGLLNVEDVPGKRRAFSMAWSGMHNARWWIDPKTGIGAVLIVNIRPHGDAVVASLYRELEEAVYGGLLKAKGKL